MTILELIQKPLQNFNKKSVLISKNTMLVYHEDKSIWLRTGDLELMEFLAKTWRDELKMKLIMGVNRPITISELLMALDVPQTSGYRKINELVTDQFMVQVGYVESVTAKKQSKVVELYDRIFSEILLHISTQSSYAELKINSKMISKIQDDHITKHNNKIG